MSLSQVIAVASSVCSGIAIIVGDLSQAALLPAHTAAVVLAIVAAVSTVLSTINQVENTTNS